MGEGKRRNVRAFSNGGRQRGVMQNFFPNFRFDRGKKASPNGGRRRGVCKRFLQGAESVSLAESLIERIFLQE